MTRTAESDHDFHPRCIEDAQTRSLRVSHAGCITLLASLRDAIVEGRWSGGVARTLLNHRLQAEKPPASSPAPTGLRPPARVAISELP